MRILALFFIVLMGCSQTGSGQSEDKNKLIQSTYSFSQKDARAADLASLTKLDDRTKELIKSFLGWNDTSFEAYIYESIEDSKASVVLMSSVRGKTLYLLIKDDEIKEFAELTKDQCDLMDQFDDYELIRCKTMSASIEGNKLLLYKNLIDTKDFGDRTESVKDSLTFNYQLGNDMRLISKDSVRTEY